MIEPAAEARLRERQPVLADVIDSDRAIAAMVHAGVVDIEALRLRRERRRAAERSWGFQIRGDGDRHG